MDSSPNLCNTLHYLYDKPDSHYSQLVMASRKAEMETLGSSVSKDRAKSAIVGTNTDLAEAKANSELSYEAIPQQNSLSNVYCSQPGQPRTDQV